MGTNQVIIGVGTNIQPLLHINEAKKYIQVELRLIGESSFIETEPVGLTDQPNFQNGAFLVETDMDRSNLKQCLIKIENKMGRIKGSDKNGPRTIDLDILVWNGKIVDKDVFERNFLKNSILELCPEMLIHFDEKSNNQSYVEEQAK